MKDQLLCEGGNPLDANSEYCCEPECQACCPHDEHDHYVCLDCGAELDPGVDIDRAMDSIDTER